MSEKDLPKIDAAEASPEKERAKKPETAAQTRQERIAEIDAEISRLSRSEASSKDGPGLHAEKEDEYQEETGALETMGIPISEESKGMLHEHLVDDRTAAAERRDRRLDELEAEKLHRLLLTPEEERTIRESGEENRELKRRSENGAEIVVHGMREHTQSVKDMGSTIAAYMQAAPDIVMVEGGLSLEDVYPGEVLSKIMEKDPVQVLMEKGEQIFMAFLATRDGKDVRSWDTSLIDQIQAVLEMKDGAGGGKKWKPEDVTDWIVAYASRTTLTIGKTKLSADAIRERTSRPLPPDAIHKMASWGIELTDENIEAALQKHMGLSLKELAERYDDPETRKEDEARLIEMTEPELVDERRVTSDVLRDMNIVRDQHAIDAFRELQKRHPDKKLFVTAGASHLTTWRPAIEELYKE